MVYLKNCLTISHLDIHSTESIVLKFGGSNEITVEIRSPNIEERDKGHKSFNAFCDTVGSFTPTPKALPVFEAISEGKLPPEEKQAKTVADMTRTSGPHVSLDHYPTPFISYVDKARKEMVFYPRKAIKILRWRYAQQGPLSPISSRGNYFSFDLMNWFTLPGQHHIEFSLRSYSVLRTENINEKELVDLIQKEIDEPLAHELYRESQELKLSNPRSCLILAISSLEIGVKECIFKLVPNSEWLVKNLPTPPILKILKEYFPLLPCVNNFAGKVLSPPKTILDTIEKGINIRNELTHKGTGTPKRETLEEILEAVFDVLWLCDYYCGFDWAKNHMNKNTLSILESN